MQVAGVLALMGAGGYLVTRNRTKGIQREDQSRGDSSRKWEKEYQEHGMLTDLWRSYENNVTSLNQAWKPRTAPRQEATDKVTDVMKSEAQSQSYVDTYYPEFFFNSVVPEIPLNTAEQGKLLIELPSEGSSIRGDEGNSLAYNPRAYTDYYGQSQNPHVFTGQGNTWGAGEPTESEEVHPYPYNPNIPMYDPFGPGGFVQDVRLSNQAAVSRRQGVNQSTILAPAPTRSMFSS